MRVNKKILGIGFLSGSLLPMGTVIFLFPKLDGIQRQQIVFVVLFYLAIVISLSFFGWFMITRRNLRMSQESALLISLSFCCFGLCMAIAIPNFIKARVADSLGPRGHCINNLRQIDAAANQFALEKGLTNGQPIHFPDDLTPYIKLNSAGKIPPCPAGGVYHVSKVGETPTCTLSTLTPPHAL